MDLSVDSFISLENVSLAYPVFGHQKANIQTAAAENRASFGAISSNVKLTASVSALHNINLLIKPGDRVAIVGRNGAGKTTLLRVMSKIYPPSSGTVVTKGRIATLFQMGLGMRPTASGYRNIFLQGLVNGYSKAQIEAFKDEIVEFTELGDFLHLPVNTYSQGMAMRLSFAIATSMNPDILVMDEWLGAGDKRFRKKASQRMNQVFKRAGIAILASHNRDLLLRTCDKAIWLDAGKQMAFDEIRPVLKEMDSFYGD